MSRRTLNSQTIAIETSETSGLLERALETVLTKGAAILHATVTVHNVDKSFYPTRQDYWGGRGATVWGFSGGAR
jgi:hypothetical protein